MKGYNVAGYGLIVAYALACMYFAPAALGPWAGLAIGAAYFVACWFVGGVYLSCVIHMGIAHRALDYKEWFVHAITLVNNTFGVYVNPITWVNRHRLHHKHADHEDNHQIWQRIHGVEETKVFGRHIVVGKEDFTHSCWRVIH